ncbi:MAG: hypothetical protein LIP12_03015 [Clostridiales bacterium]|nr:hypothetical protein [Clostridiales bacterium]
MEEKVNAWNPEIHLIYLEAGKNVFIRYTTMEYLKKKRHSQKEKSMARPFQMEDVPGLLQYKSSVGQGYGNLFNAHLLLLQEKLRKKDFISGSGRKLCGKSAAGQLQIACRF